MDRQKVEEVRNKVSCVEVLVDAGFHLDRRESSRRALKFRRDGEIIIVTHGGIGWFDPLSEEKGDVFALASLLKKVPFSASVELVASLAGLQLWQQPDRRVRRLHTPVVAERWARRPSLALASATYRYLNEVRKLPSTLLTRVARSDIVRQGPGGSAWFAHRDTAGCLSGWEERGPQWRGFSTGGAKTLFRFGPHQFSRICITEAAIDALSLAAIERVRPDTLYTSTGGGWSAATDEAIRAAAAGAMLVAATDADPQGEVYADRLRRIADLAACDFLRLRPRAIDWNEDLKEQRREEEELPHARATASRVKLRPPDGGP